MIKRSLLSIILLASFIFSLNADAEENFFSVRTGSIEWQKLQLEKSIKETIETSLEDYVPKSYMQVKVQVSLSSRRSSRGKKTFALDKLGTVATISPARKGTRSLLQRISQVRVNYLIDEAVPKKTIETVKEITKRIIPFVAASKVKVSVFYIEAAPMSWHDLLYRYRYVFVVTGVILFISILFLVFLKYGMLALKTMFDSFNHLVDGVGANPSTRATYQQTALTGTSGLTGLTPEAETLISESSSNQTFFEDFEGLCRKIDKGTVEDEREIFKGLVKEARIGMLKALAYRNFPHDLVVDLPPYLLKRFLADLTFERRVSLIGNMRNSDADKLLSAFGAPGSKDYEFLKYEVENKMKARSDSPAILEQSGDWAEFVSSIRKSLATNARLRVEFEPIINDWISKMEREVIRDEATRAA